MNEMHHCCLRYVSLRGLLLSTNSHVNMECVDKSIRPRATWGNWIWPNSIAQISIISNDVNCN
jgi:hypothetical protein